MIKNNSNIIWYYEFNRLNNVINVEKAYEITKYIRYVVIFFFILFSSLIFKVESYVMQI